MTGVIERFGALGVFLLMVPESACVPLPSEVTLLFSGFAVHRGWMSFPLAVLAATAGNLLGSLLAYGMGASHLLERVPLARTVMARWEGLLDRYGTRAVFLARLLPLARTFVSLPAGARQMELIPFWAEVYFKSPVPRGCEKYAANGVSIYQFRAGSWRFVGGGSRFVSQGRCSLSHVLPKVVIADFGPCPMA